MTTRRSFETVCQACWAYTLTGLDADALAFTVTVDDTPLTRAGELLAVLAGRSTYSRDIRGELSHRDRYALRSPSPDPVHATHIHDQPLPSAWLAPTPRTTAPTPTTEESF